MRHTAVDEGPMLHQPEHALHLSADQLAAHLERRLYGSEREAVVAHLVQCADCRCEYVAAGEVVGAARRNWIGLRAGIGLAAAAVVIATVIPRAVPRPEATVTRDVSTQRVAAPDVSVPIRLAAPADGERLTGVDVRLSWHAHGNDVLYRVIVQTDVGGVVWKSETRDTTSTLPPSVQLTGGATYYWIVYALNADGLSARSPTNAFIR